MTNIASNDDPLGNSLWGEYARMLLIATAVCSALWWAVRFIVEPAAAVMVAVNAMLLIAVVSGRLAGLPRLVLLTVLASGVVAAIAVKETTDWWRPFAIFSPVVAIACLLLLVVRDIVILIRRRSGKVSTRTVVVVSAIVAAAVYMILIPGVDAFLEQYRDSPESYTIEDLTVFQELRVRTAKLALFAIFAYVGACVGSFINVVAASAPLGESITFRSSSCPRCKIPIRRIDNLPIFSYLNLGGRCRNCGVRIPIRYLVVEVVGLAIFSLLFLYELVTGAANIPGFETYHHAGILWVILYTKWPVVGVYILHCALFSCLLMLALMERDRLRAPRWMVFLLMVGVAGAVIAIPTMLTPSLVDQTPFQLPTKIRNWIDRTVTSAAGGLVGWFIGSYSSKLRLRRRQSSASLTLGFVLLGVSLGWQAVVTIAIFWLIATGLLRFFGGRRLRPQYLTPTTLLFAAAMLHHPAWKWMAERISF